MRILAALFCLIAGPALALSCLPPDPVRDFIQADEAEDIWIVVEGRLNFDSSRLPEQDLARNDAPPETDIPARLEGLSLGPDGFSRAFDRDITLRVLCFGPWCGGAEAGRDYLGFLKREGDGYVAFADPCGNRLYAEPTDAMRDALTRCMRGDVCQPAPLR